MTTREYVETTLETRIITEEIAVPEDTSSYIDEVEQSIKNYCNIDTVPEELKFVWISMTMDYLRWVPPYKKDPTSGNGSPIALTSLREGDTNLGFSIDTHAIAHSSQNVLDQIVLNYQDQLNRFRRVVW